MRIAILSYHTCPIEIPGIKNTGGMNIYIRELAIYLGNIGINLDIFTRSQDSHVPHIVHDLGYGNRVVHIKSGSEIPLPKEVLANHIPKFTENIIEFVNRKQLKYDLIHSHYWMSGISAIELSNQWNIPIIHMFHTLGLMKNRVAREGESEGDYRIKGEREVIRSVDKIIAATPAELAQLQWLYETNIEHVTVIPPGVNTKNFYPIPTDEAREYINVPNNKRMVLFVGRIEPLKGIDTLIKSISLLIKNKRNKQPDICLAIIGGNKPSDNQEMSQEMKKLHKLIEDLNLKDAVKFLGQRPQNLLPYYYSAADIAVVPSHYESFGMVALESMACGTPVIASQVGGLAYLINDGKTGFHVPDQDANALSDRLSEVLFNDNLLEDVGAQASIYAKDYSWEKITPQIVAVYQEVINKTKRKTHEA